MQKKVDFKPASKAQLYKVHKHSGKNSQKRTDRKPQIDTESLPQTSKPAKLNINNNVVTTNKKIVTQLKSGSTHQVKGDSTRQVKSDSKHQVKGDSTHLVKGDSTHQVKGNSTHQVKGDSSTQTGSSANHKKKRKCSKKVQDGVSNWMKLCSTLNIDATVRKTKPDKRPSEEATSEPTKRAKPSVWFDDVDDILIEKDVSNQAGQLESSNQRFHKNVDALVKPDSFQGVTNCVAMDCEMVGVGPSGVESILARVSLVNHFGVCIYDKFVLPRETVTDYRTFVSGVTPENLATGEEFTKVQSEVSNILKGRILVGHAVDNDLRVLFLTHPRKMIRDTSAYKPFRELFSGRKPSLKKLTEKVLAVKVQEGQHDSVQDAQATMRLYTMHRQRWEKELRKEGHGNSHRKKKMKDAEKVSAS